MRRNQEKKKFFSGGNMIAMFIAFIMITSVIGYMWGESSSERFDYKDYKFTRQNSQWMLKYEDKNINFDYFPEDVERITIDNNAISMLKEPVEIDSTYDPKDLYVEAFAEAQYEMNEALSKVSSKYIRTGMTAENEYEVPIITCRDATASVPVVYFKKSNETKVSVDGSCVIAEAKDEIDVLMIKDRILYGILGII